MLLRRLIVISFVLLLVGGCALHDSGPTAPSLTDSPYPVMREPDYKNREVISAGEIIIDPVNMTAEIAPLRDLESHYNIRGYLMPPQCSDCLVINVLGLNSETRIMSVNLSLKNSSVYTAYDIRCVVHTDNEGHYMTNPDGWTGLWSFTGGDTVNPFRAFGKDKPNRKFTPGTTLTELIQLYIPDPPMYGAIAYVIDGSYPGNCTEPYLMDGLSQTTVYNTEGAIGDVSIDVFDWQNDVGDVTITSQALMGAQVAHLNQADINTWTGQVSNITGMDIGSYPAMITAYSGTPSRELYHKVNISVTAYTPGINDLFAERTTEDLQLVRNDWANRDMSVVGFQIEGSVELPDGEIMAVVSHTINGDRHYGIIGIPPGATEPGSTPVLVIAHGGYEGVSDDWLHKGDSVANHFIQVLPSFRGEPLYILSGPLMGLYMSEGVQDKCDTDADDAIILLSATLENFAQCDSSRIAAMGTSRGGGVALRMKIRDVRLKGAIDLYGNADYLTDSMKLAAEARLEDPAHVPLNPIEDCLFGYVIDPFRTGEIGFAEARHRLFLASPAYFGGTLPRTQVHHGTNDTTVPVDQSDSLALKMTELGIYPPDFEYYRYEGGIHSMSSLLGAGNRVLMFLDWVTQ